MIEMECAVDGKYIFDKQDADLFLVEDRDLKARAIRCSIIPRLLELANAAIAEAAELYGVEPLETATVAYSPYRIESRGSGFKCLNGISGVVCRVVRVQTTVRFWRSITFSQDQRADRMT